ncbi:MAG: FHA domain-containing protein [Lentisphaerae bacterium]|nr:FHA domain-containing protein [Lentisphaerota bacterium]
MATLFIRETSGERPLIALTGDQTIFIGRSPDCDAVIQHPEVSSRHAKLSASSTGWVIEDLDSANGTDVNGQTISAPTLLADNSTIVMGGAVYLRFADTSPQGTPQAPSTPPPVAPSRPTPAASEDDIALVRNMRDRTTKIRQEVAKVIVGQVDVIDQVLMVLIAGGHGLLVGMPGMAKTLLVATIAKVLDMAFRRVQFTPDLMPTDITGTEVLETDPETQQKSFRFVKGPIFTNLLLADEINRTPPKTQAALLEAMQEKCVTIGNETYKLDPPFFVLATQNPIEQEGTYPLPEAQQDRFMFNLWVDYPKEDEEEQIVKSTTVESGATPQKVVSQEELLQLQRVVRSIPVSDHIIKYAIRLVRATRPEDTKSPEFIKKYVHNGAGPRAGQFLVLAAKARAVLEGRVHVSCADVAKAALPVLRHRILANFAADSEGISTSDLVDRLLKEIEQPGERDY